MNEGDRYLGIVEGRRVFNIEVVKRERNDLIYYRGRSGILEEFLI